MIEVDVPDVGTVEFPDSMSQEDIQTALKKQSSGPKPQPLPEDSTGKAARLWQTYGPPAGGTSTIAGEKPTASIFESFLPEMSRDTANTVAAQILNQPMSPGGMPAIIPGATPVTPQQASGVGGVVRGVYEGGVRPIVSPGGLATLALAPGLPAVAQRLIPLVFAPGMAKTAGKKFGEFSVSGDPEDLTEGVIAGGAAALSPAGILGITGAMRASIPETLREAAQTIKAKGTPNASRQQETAEIHGNVRPREESSSQLPQSEGGRGIQPQTEGRLPNEVKEEQQRLLLSEDLQAGQLSPEKIGKLTAKQLEDLDKSRNPQTGAKYSLQKSGILWGAKLPVSEIDTVTQLGVKARAKFLDFMKAKQWDSPEAAHQQRLAQYYESVAEGIRGANNLPGVRATYDALARSGEIKPQEAGEPAGLRQKSSEKGQKEFYLPPLPKGVSNEGVRAEETPRLKLTPADIDWSQRGQEGSYRSISDAEAVNPKALGKIITADSRIEGSQSPVSSSRRLVVLLDKKTGEVHMVSAYRSGRSGTMVTDPGKVGVSKPNVPIAQLLDRYKPVYSVLRDSPVKNFHQRFESMDDYQARFGDEATQSASQSLGAGAAQGQAQAREPSVPPQYPSERPEPNTATDAELKAFHDFFEGEIPPSKDAFDRQIGAAAAKASRQMVSAVHKAYLDEAIRNPKASPESNLGSALSKLYEDLSKSQTRSDFIRTSQKRFAEPVASTLSQGESAAPAGLRQAGRTVHDTASDEIKAIAQDIGDLVRNAQSADRIASTFDAASNLPNNAARRAEMGVRIKSVQKPAGMVARMATQWGQGDKDVLAAANAVVQAGGDHAKLPDFQTKVAEGRAAGEKMSKSGSLRMRMLGKAWVRAADELKRELDYAQAHWNDPDLQATAQRMARELDEQLKREKDAGLDITKLENYLPNRYDASLWSGHSVMFREVRLLGRRFDKARVFPSYYDAIANGPYLAVTRDGASLVGHRVRQGMQQIAMQQWREGLKAIRMDDGRPLAIEPVPDGKGGWKWPPNFPGANEYEFVYQGRRKPILVHSDYSKLIRNLTSESPVEDWWLSRNALLLTQNLKHTLLIGDFFHLARMGYYGLSIMGKAAGWKGGWSTLDIAPRDVPEAIRRGVIRQEDADWAAAPVKVGNVYHTRRQIAEAFQEQGLNVGKIQDALYKDLLTQLTPTAGAIRRGVTRVIDPTTGRYNRFLFDKMTRGLMLESSVREFERQTKANPELSPEKLMRDIARDTNVYYGNLGRQGLLKAKWEQDLARMFFLAPQWIESLARKELTFYSRASGLAKVAGFREGVSNMGTIGKGIGTGLASMFALTQLVNYATRGHSTFQNPEKEHLFDAWIPAWGGRKEGFWMNPLTVFNELSHDVYRLIMAKPKSIDVFNQIAGNKESPLMRAVMIGFTGVEATGQYATTSMNQLGAAAQQLVPMPITFGRYAQLAGHAVAPNLVSPPPPGSVQRQAFATAGIKIEPESTSVTKIGRLASEFMRQQGLKKETGWKEVETDEASYTKLRNAIRSGDEKEMRRNYQALLKGRNETQIIKAMKLWAKRPFTGSQNGERLFVSQLSNEEADLYWRAQQDRQDMYQQFQDWLLRQP